MKITKVEPVDLPQIVDIQKQYFSQHNYYELAYLKQMIKNKDVVFIKLVNQKHIIGYLLSYILVDHIDIYQIAIDHSFLHQGYGTQLIKELECHHLPICVEVKTTNQSAINFYLKHNFVIKKQMKKYYDTLDAYLMVKS